ncbi:hypothetical protein FACS189418_4390 [Clostridia bacterium]|nr:hypothetical protein FACS189418_4390 [Clostridia bacterium]
MKKQIKWAVGVVASLALTATLGVTIFAANGWTLNGKNWFYFEDNEAVRGEWKLAADGRYYYLGDDGVMLTNTVVDDLYYVDSHGMRVTNQWRLLPSVSIDGEKSWYYFGQDGKVTLNSTKTINGKTYSFSAEGEMIWGWVHNNGKFYFHGGPNDGARVYNTWINTYSEVGDEDNKYWYFLSTSGTRINSKMQKINNKNYYFDENGRMLCGWLDVSGSTATPYWGAISAKPQDVIYCGQLNQGNVQTGWVKVTPPDNPDGEAAWFYFQSNGRPHVWNGDLANLTKKIGTKTYAFDREGQMLSGVKTFVTQSGQVHRYYFGKINDGELKTGKQTIEDDNGETFNAYFYLSTAGEYGKGAGVTGAASGSLYHAGLRLDAPSGSIYAITSAGGSVYLVSESGKLQIGKTSGVKDGNDIRLYTNASGKVIKAVAGTTTVEEFIDAGGEGKAKVNGVVSTNNFYTYLKTVLRVEAIESVHFAFEPITATNSLTQSSVPAATQSGELFAAPFSLEEELEAELDSTTQEQELDSTEAMAIEKLDSLSVTEEELPDTTEISEVSAFDGENNTNIET